MSIFSSKILPIYQAHEADFDLIGFHGRRHLTRSVIFAEIMIRFYISQSEADLDFEGIRLAVSFHDLGREANGRDYWEAESAENCYEYLLEMDTSEDYAKNISKTILQKKHDIKNRLSQIIYDADVLEIMRLFVERKNGDQKFRASELFFLGNNELHSSFSLPINFAIMKIAKSSLNITNNVLMARYKKVQIHSNKIAD